MKKILIVLIFISPFFCKAQVPVAFYPFTSNANDAIGTNNGTVNGATLTTDRFGLANSAYNFNGTSDFISTSNVATTNTNNWTMTAWVKPASLSQLNGTIVLNGFENGVTGNGYVMCMGNSDGGSPGNTLSGFLNGVNYVSGGSNFPNNNFWYHVAMVRQAGVTKFYINASQSANTNSGTPNTPSGSVRMGSSNGVRFWNGAIDDVKIFNVALTAAQIQNEYNPTPYSTIFGNNIQTIITSGVNNYINVPNNTPIPSSGNVTVEAWLNSTVSTSNSPWFKKGVGNGYGLYLLNNTIFVITFGVVNWNTGVILKSNTWYHVSFTYDGSTQRIYVNGILASTINAGYVTANNTCTIGYNDVGGETGNFIGQIDEVRVWNTARTQSQILATINAPLIGNETGLVGYWDMNRSGQGTGLAVNNLATVSGASLNGITVGNATAPIFTNSVLPLQFISFTARRIDEANILQWQTANEINTQSFSLERSNDGIYFKEINTMNAANSTGTHYYEYKDENAVGNTLYYRIKQIDINGRFTYSPIVKLENNNTSKMSIFPNPSSDFVAVNFSSKQKNIVVTVLNALGEKLLVETFKPNNPILINVKTLAKGNYFINANDGFKNTTYNFIKN